MRWVMVVAVVAGALATSAAGPLPQAGAAASAAPGEISAEVRDLCTRAATLRAAGEESDAVAHYKRALERSPTSPCATKGLQDGPPASLASVLDDVVELLLAAGLALLALFCLLLLGHWRWMHRTLVRVWGLGRMLSPRLTLSALGDQSGLSVGGTLDARIKKQLAEMRRFESLEKAPPYEIDFGTPREDFADLVAGDGGLRSALSKASESSEQLKIVAALLTLMYTLLPTQRLTVSGVVEPVIGPCASMTLNLEDGGRPIAAATLLGSVPPDGAQLTAADFVKLADPAAVWIQYEVARAIRGDIDRGPDAAVAYALVREGLEKQLAGDAQAARAKFAQARELDGRNWAASLNLAMTEARLAQDYDRAIEILDSAFREIQHR